MVSSYQTRRSMQARRSTDPRSSMGSHGHMEGEGLMRGYDEESGQYAHSEESDDRSNGHASKQYESIEMDTHKASRR